MSGANCLWLSADRPGLRPETVSMANCRLVRFSESDLIERNANARAELRTRSRGLVMLCALLRQLGPPWQAHTGVYLYCGPGPSHAKTQQEALRVASEQRAAVIEKNLPPKDYFISNPAMKAAQLSIEFQLHGPWTAFLSPRHGLLQALECARNDLEDGVVPAALVGGLFALDEPTELAHYTPCSSTLVEAVWAQYAVRPEQLERPEDRSGRYGPLTPLAGERSW